MFFSSSPNVTFSSASFFVSCACIEAISGDDFEEREDKRAIAVLISSERAFRCSSNSLLSEKRRALGKADVSDRIHQYIPSIRS